MLNRSFFSQCQNQLMDLASEFCTLLVSAII